jgi:polyhydroxybutyrate depolymerase
MSFRSAAGALVVISALAAAACSAKLQRAENQPTPEEIFSAGSETARLRPLPSAGCRVPFLNRTHAQSPGGTIERAISSGGHVRRFLLALPTDEQLLKPVPLVLNLHGVIETAELQQVFSGMQSQALQRGWAIAWPQGIGNSWNAGSCCGRSAAEEIDDVQYVRDLVALVGREVCIDLRRVYATGMSNGGFMSYRLGCEASDLIAAIAPVAAVDIARDCPQHRPVPVLAFNGTSDHVVPYDGRAWSDFPSVEESFTRWRKRNQCTGAAKDDRQFFQNGDTKCLEATGCAPNGELVFCAIDGGGHTWPGGMFAPYLGKTSDAVDASAAILDFFSAHARPDK